MDFWDFGVLGFLRLGDKRKICCFHQSYCMFNNLVVKHVPYTLILLDFNFDSCYLTIFPCELSFSI